MNSYGMLGGLRPHRTPPPPRPHWETDFGQHLGQNQFGSSVSRKRTSYFCKYNPNSSTHSFVNEPNLSSRVVWLGEPSWENTDLGFSSIKSMYFFWKNPIMGFSPQCYRLPGEVRWAEPPRIPYLDENFYITSGVFFKIDVTYRYFVHKPRVPNLKSSRQSENR